MSAAKKLRDPAAAVARAREKPAPASTPGPRYADRIKVYPQRIDGRFRRIKWAILAFCLTVYYVAPWLRWDRGPNAPGQALLIDLPVRRAYFFGLEIWPQEVYFLTGLLIIAAIGLFLATSLLGRVWCGYACPQTVWTDLFMMVERLIEGDRNARMRLDKAPFGAAKAAKKLAKHAAWLLIAAATGGAWVLYFQDAPTALREILTGGASAQTYFFVGLFTTTTYLLAGWAREQVCTYMCPWPRFQSAMLDEQSIIVTYEAWRGEPRGKHKAGTSWEGRGDCVDCMKCVAVCPTGIDIRDGQQLECIGCGLCIDACNTVMAQVGRPGNLITFDTLANQEAEAAGKKPVYRLIRPRTVIYASLLLLASGVMATALLLRAHLDITVLHERSPLFVRLSDGEFRNGFTIRILNKTYTSARYSLTLHGLADYRVDVVGMEAVGGPRRALTLTAKPDAVATYRLYLTAKRGELHGETTPIVFEIEDQETHEMARHDSIFVGPGK
ncbi:MAG TPA: cytochrome c oxidase accessory protein CcoG [Alphaproteobacteria bacterium]|nr:cytochrome c oxidase accessory protein CcoG [Alphaproteobacteria bacterium]